jgi:hypothetical protein
MWMVDCGGRKRVSVRIWLRVLFGYKFCLVTSFVWLQVPVKTS